MSERISSPRLSVQGPFLVSVTEPWVSEDIQRASVQTYRPQLHIQ